MKTPLLSVALTTCFLISPAKAESLKVVQIADLPVAQLSAPHKELAYLQSPLIGDNIPLTVNVSLDCQYGPFFSEKEPQRLPGNWTLTWETTGKLQTGAVATLRRDDTTVKVGFEQRGLDARLYRLAGSPPARIFQAIELNSKYLAIQGAGDWEYRFVDKLTGEVLPYGLAGKPNHFIRLYVDRKGTPYAETVAAFHVGSAATKHAANGIHKLQFDSVSLTAPLTEAQATQWDKSE